VIYAALLAFIVDSRQGVKKVYYRALLKAGVFMTKTERICPVNFLKNIAIVNFKCQGPESRNE